MSFLEKIGVRSGNLKTMPLIPPELIELRAAALNGEFPEVPAKTVLSWFHADPGTGRRLLGEIIDWLGIDTRPKILHCSVSSRIVVFRRGVPPPEKAAPPRRTSETMQLPSDWDGRLDTLRSLKRKKKPARLGGAKDASVVPVRP